MASGKAVDLQSILRTKSPVAVLTGAAASGKTSRVLEFYRHFQDEIGRPRCLLIAPNAPAQDSLRRQLLAGASGVLLAPAITTFAGLAGRVLAQAGRAARKLTSVQRRLLLERVVRDLHAGGRLKVLGDLIDTPGLVPALDQSIAELKRSAIAPEDLQSVIDPSHDKNADLLAVYQAYQQHLLDEGRFDMEGLLWLARDVLRANPQAALGWDVQALAVDGFIDFTPTQLEILAVLAGRMSKTLITLPYAHQEQRQRLWQWTQRTLDEMRKTLSCEVLSADQPSMFEGLFDLSVLTGELDKGASPGHESDVKSGAKHPQVRVLSAGGIEAEVRAVAAAVKADLSGVGVAWSSARCSGGDHVSSSAGSGDPKRDLSHSDSGAWSSRTAGVTMPPVGMPPVRIGVLVRTLEGYEEPISRIFAQFGIPVAERPKPLDESPVIRFLLGVLALPPRHLMPDVLTAVGNSYFDPTTLGAFDASLAQVACMAIRAGNVLEGRGNYAKALERLIHLAQRDQQAEEDESDARWPVLAQPESLNQASAMLEALFDLLDGASAAQDAPAFAAAVRQVMERLDLSGQAMKLPGDRMVAAQLRALAAFDEVLAELERSELLPVAGRGPQTRCSAFGVPVSPALGGSWEELLGLLNRLVRSASVPPARGEELVTVQDVLDARAVRFDRVYLLGLNEKAFPQLSSERCFIDESDRHAWSAGGLRLDRRSDLLGREMLLFYLACTRASESLQISYATSDSSGASRSASTFIEEFTQACRWQGLEVPTIRLSPGEIVPPINRIACPQDVLHAAIFNAFSTGVAWSSARCSGGDHVSRGAWSGVPKRDVSRLGIPSQTTGMTMPPTDVSSLPNQETVAKSLLAALAQRDPQRLEHACWGILATRRRWNEGEVDEFDGRLNEPALLALLAERLKNSTFSASEFNTFATCPWQFLARYVLRLEELPEPSAQLTPVQRGSFMHAVLWRVMTTLRQRQGEFVDLSKIEQEELLAVLAEAVETERSRMAGFAAYEELWRIETAHWARQLERYLLDQRAKWERKAVYFELGFGLGGHAGKRSDVASQKQAVEIDLGGRSVRMVGKIDRVDIDDQGRTVIVDYKSGHRPMVADMIFGLDLQLGLYAVAIEKLLGKPCAGGEYHGLRDAKYTHFRLDKVSASRANIQKKGYAELLKDLLATARRYLQAMEEGRFDALPARDCPMACPYPCICQYSPTRSQRKSGGHRIAPVEEEADE